MTEANVRHLVRRSSDSSVIVKLMATPPAFDIRMKIDHLPRVQEHPAVRLLTNQLNHHKHLVNASSFDLTMVSQSPTCMLATFSLLVIFKSFLLSAF